MRQTRSRDLFQAPNASQIRTSVHIHSVVPFVRIHRVLAYRMIRRTGQCGAKGSGVERTADRVEGTFCASAHIVHPYHVDVEVAASDTAGNRGAGQVKGTLGAWGVVVHLVHVP